MQGLVARASRRSDVLGLMQQIVSTHRDEIQLVGRSTTFFREELCSRLVSCCSLFAFRRLESFVRGQRRLVVYGGASPGRSDTSTSGTSTATATATASFTAEEAQWRAAKAQRLPQLSMAIPKFFGAPRACVARPAAAGQMVIYRSGGWATRVGRGIVAPYRGVEVRRRNVEFFAWLGHLISSAHRHKTGSAQGFLSQCSDTPIEAGDF